MEIIGELQLRVMHVLWKDGANSVHHVHNALNAQPNARQLAYTTVLTVMRNLARRKIVVQTANGRAHLFTPTCSCDEFKSRFLKAVVAAYCTDKGDTQDAINARLVELLSMPEASVPTTQGASA